VALAADRGGDVVELALRMVLTMMNLAPAAGITVAEKASDPTIAVEPADRAMSALALGLAELMGSRPVAALLHFAEALRLGDASGTPAAAIPAAVQLAVTSSYAEPRASLAMFEEAIARAGAGGEPVWHALGVGNQALVRGIYLGDLAAAEEGFARAAAIAADGVVGSVVPPWLAGWRAVAAVNAGDLARARTLAGEGEAWLREVSSWGPNLDAVVRTSVMGIVVFYGAALVQVWSGAPVPEAHRLAELAVQAEAEGLAVAVMAFRYVTGLLALRDGHPLVAVTELTSAYDAGASIGFTSFMGLMAGSAGLAAAAAADRDGAVRWAEVTESLADAQGMIEPAGLALLLRADIELLDGTNAVAAHEAAQRAVAHTHRHGYRLQLVGALERLARAEFALGDAVAAARLLGATTRARHDLGIEFRFGTDDPADVVRPALGAAASDDAAATGAALDLDATVELVQRTRGTRKRPAVGWASLTPTERQVVDLVVGGLSNPQVAQRLLMSRETVKTHLTHVFGKLGIANRTELATFVAVRDRS
jgi:DNA-binding CsgD family transcriptional regulator